MAMFIIFCGVHHFYGVNVTMHSFWEQELNLLKSEVNEEFYLKAFESV